MRFISGYDRTRQRGLGPFAGFILIALMSAAISVAFAAQGRVKLLYFFSASCKYCIDARPAVIDLGKEYDIEGLLFKDGNPQSFPFPIKAGDKKIAKEVYGVKGVPTLAILVDGKYRQKISGAPDIQDAKTIIEALAGGAVTVSEAAKKTPGADITITGWITAKGAYFKNAQFFITDRETDLPIKAWLPIEAVKSPFRKTRPRLMSDVVNKPVALRGELTKRDQTYEFIVKEEVKLQDDRPEQTQKPTPLR